ncbi:MULTISPECIES: ABC transporter permease [unclassified Streptomyces]|uniref:ABC transporter permease n=1 Tax=unclassified Streptomyces TaxID=2593676 RepID=UPI002DDBAB4F|nr:MULTISPECIES: ABC transporter permease [unclassified Streptomyces]WSA92309.1 ABC transporter permease [Streptomyces sp. NBC_01795]WSS15035.1 ABC transporter permease [Streptomyces sp. NBC_01186]WSS43878.1 ABC transporter permease [Streptomyces sp. NBC_01187]
MTTTRPSADPARSPRPRPDEGASSAVTSARAVQRVEFRLFLREPGALFGIVVFPAALLTILGLIPSFREASEDLGGRRVVDLYVPVTVLLAMIVAGIQSMPGVLTGYRERGILRRLRTTPARPGSLLSAQIILHGCASAVSVALVLAIGRLAFDVALPRQVAGYVLATLLTTFAALALGAAITAYSRTTKIAQTVGTLVFFPMMFTAGVWTPVQTMPEMLRHIVEFTPFGAASQALNQATTGSWPDWSHLGVTGLWAVLLTGAAVRWFRWE